MRIVKDNCLDSIWIWDIGVEEPCSFHFDGNKNFIKSSNVQSIFYIIGEKRIPINGKNTSVDLLNDKKQVKAV